VDFTKHINPRTKQ